MLRQYDVGCHSLQLRYKGTDLNFEDMFPDVRAITAKECGLGRAPEEIIMDNLRGTYLSTETTTLHGQVSGGYAL